MFDFETMRLSLSGLFQFEGFIVVILPAVSYAIKLSLGIAHRSNSHSNPSVMRRGLLC